MSKIKKAIRKILKVGTDDAATKIGDDYFNRFKKYSFVDCECSTEEQFEASIIRLYHTIEKGLSYENYRAGFGKNNVEKLLLTLEQYSTKFDVSKFCYKTALSCLMAYIAKNKEHGLNDPELEERIGNLPGAPNENGGTILATKPDLTEMKYVDVIKGRHSIRHFSDTLVDVEQILKAVKLAQYTPSACNRQGWMTRIVTKKEDISRILENQNGNKGFGQEFDKLLIVTADLQAFQRSREVFQAFIDGGMYAENIINSLYYYGIGSVPLSASLTVEQRKNVKDLINMNDSEEIIMFIGVGNYPSEKVLTTRSERREARYIVL